MIEKNCQILNEKNGIPKGKKSYNLSEIMAILGICRSSATKLIRTNQFRSVRIGREVRVLKSDFEETFYQKKNPTEVNGATVEPKKEPQGITEEAMLNYMVQNPDFLQKFKVLLGVGN